MSKAERELMAALAAGLSNLLYLASKQAYMPTDVMEATIDTANTIVDKANDLMDENENG